MPADVGIAAGERGKLTVEVLNAIEDSVQRSVAAELHTMSQRLSEVPPEVVPRTETETENWTTPTVRQAEAKAEAAGVLEVLCRVEELVKQAVRHTVLTSADAPQVDQTDLQMPADVGVAAAESRGSSSLSTDAKQSSPSRLQTLPAANTDCETEPAVRKPCSVHSAGPREHHVPHALRGGLGLHRAQRSQRRTAQWRAARDHPTDRKRTKLKPHVLHRSASVAAGAHTSDAVGTPSGLCTTDSSSGRNLELDGSLLAHNTIVSTAVAADAHASDVVGTQSGLCTTDSSSVRRFQRGDAV